MSATALPHFSQRLREVTQEDHTVAEASTFISTLMGGERSGRDYTWLISQYSYIYDALETEVRAQANDPAVTAIFDVALERGAQIGADLKVLLPAYGFHSLPAALPATANYVNAIHTSAKETPRLVAHHYLRYLGDLSGGLAIGRLVARHYEIGAEALNMWNFEQVSKPKVYKDKYRAKLDEYGADPVRAEALLDEAKRGFQWNKAIFDDLDKVSKAEMLSA